MAVDVFLKIDGIPGESSDDKHKDEIELLSFHWGITNPSRGPARTEDVVVVKHIDLASPALVEACCSGDAIKEAQVVFRKAGKGQQEFYKVTMEEVLITGVTPANGAGDTLPMEQVSMNFAKIVIEYAPQKPDGSMGPWVTSSCSPRGRRGT